MWPNPYKLVIYRENLLFFFWILFVVPSSEKNNTERGIWSQAKKNYL